MLTPVREGIGIAVHTLGANKLRSALTILGVVIGVSTVMKVGSTVHAGDPLLKIHARDAGRLSVALEFLAKAVEIA